MQKHILRMILVTCWVRKRVNSFKLLFPFPVFCHLKSFQGHFQEWLGDYNCDSRSNTRKNRTFHDKFSWSKLNFAKTQLYLNCFFILQCLQCDKYFRQFGCRQVEFETLSLQNCIKGASPQLIAHFAPRRRPVALPGRDTDIGEEDDEHQDDGPRARLDASVAGSERP